MLKNSKSLLESKFIEKEDGIYHMKLCRGCKTYEDAMDGILNSFKGDYVHICNISYPAMNGKVCPCSTCIIKMMCGRRCEKLNSHLGSKTPEGMDLKK